MYTHISLQLRKPVKTPGFEKYPDITPGLICRSSFDDAAAPTAEPMRQTSSMDTNGCRDASGVPAVARGWRGGADTGGVLSISDDAQYNVVSGCNSADPLDD